MLFAEGVSPAEVGVWLGCLAALLLVVYTALGIAVHAKTLKTRAPKKSLSSRYVTRAEMDEVETAMKQEIQRVEAALTGQFTRSEEYSHRRFHELADAVNSIGLQVAAMPVRVREAIDHATAPLISKVDRNTVSVTEIAARLRLAAGPEPEEEK